MTPRLALPSLVLLAACGGGGGGSSDPTPDLVLQKAAVSGEGQSATVANAVPADIRVLVLLDGAPAVGVVVTFAASAGSGSAVPSVDTTGSDGIAVTHWTLGNTAGPATLTATAAGATGSPQTFHATALAGAAATISADSGNGQVQEASIGFSRALKVRVFDALGNNVSGVSVSWGVVSGSGSVDQPSSNTDGAGRAGVGVTAGGTPGALTVRATSAAIPGDTVLFGLTVVATSTVILVKNNFFDPDALTVASGTAVKWVWSAGTHTVTPLNGPVLFPGSAVLDAPATFGPVLFTDLGVYNYECSLHAGMNGSITVQ